MLVTMMVTMSPCRSAVCSLVVIIRSVLLYPLHSESSCWYFLNYPAGWTVSKRKIHKYECYYTACLCSVLSAREDCPLCYTRSILVMILCVLKASNLMSFLCSNDSLSLSLSLSVSQYVTWCGLLTRNANVCI
jgi:hypothetical protein